MDGLPQQLRQLEGAHGPDRESVPQGGTQVCYVPGPAPSAVMPHASRRLRGPRKFSEHAINILRPKLRLFRPNFAK